MCQAPWYFTQCPAVMTVLPFWLVTESPEQEAVRPWKVKNTRPEVFTTDPPPVQAPPACGNAMTDVGEVGGTRVGRAAFAGAVRAPPGAASRSSGVAWRIRSAVQKPGVCPGRNEEGGSAAAEGEAAVRAPASRAPAARRTDTAVR
ncbi:hypothetical protein Slala02_42410 [Streptomyces lavendulae subsp. lavendulae]|nr:hypothetical protein Slala01_54320 [Streptomyces lavendulae subsp. lavendulae]GLX28421.1 hypothetical protein Slala02_42410 [Streptomyces lavendulae subsp. lavendulae]